MKVFKNEEGRKRVLASYDRLLKEWGIDYEEIDIEGTYGLTHVIIAGRAENPPLLLFHGVGDNSALMWIHNARELSDKFRIYAVDTIGGPGKSLPGAAYGKDFSQIRWIEELMDSLKISEAYAAGVSYGCYLVQLLLVRLPGRIKKAVGMAGSIALEGARSNALRMMKAFLPEALFPTDRNTLKLVEKLSGENKKMLTDNTVLMEHWILLLRNFRNMSMGYHRIERLTVSEIEMRKDRILFLIGDRDILSYYPKSLETLDKVGAEYMIIKGCGHSINHEKPEEIDAIIIDYLSPTL